MVTSARTILVSFAAALSALLFVPMIASADSTSQLTIITQSSYNTTAQSSTVTVNGTGVSLSGYPSNSNTLSYTANFNGDSRTVKMFAGSYSVVSPTYSNQSVTYSSGCTGYLSNGDSQICTITSYNGTNGGQYGNGRLNVSLNVVNSTGHNKIPSDFTVAISGNNPNVSSFQGTSGTTQVALSNGYYSVTIANAGSYYVTRSADCSGTINSGDTRSCTLTVNTNLYGGNTNTNGNMYYVNGTQCYYGTSYGTGTVCYQGGSNYNGGVYYVNGTSCNYNTSYTYGSNCYNGTYGTTYVGNVSVSNAPLTCTPSTQTVLSGQTASFTAYGGSGPYTWTAGGRSYFAVGPQLNTVLPSTGLQTVQVSNGYQTASCTVTVLPRQYVSGTVLSGVVLGTSTAIPGLPNTGNEPSTVGYALALLGALVAFPLSLLIAYPHAKKTALTFFR